MPPEVNSANCPLCKGAQWLYETKGEEVIPTRCRCLERKLLHDFLGPEIYRAPWVPSSLYNITTNEAGEVEGDRTEENLFLKGSWAVVCQHLHWALSAKRLYSPRFNFKIVGNDKLMTVWLGLESYTQRSTATRNEIETNNSLDDLLGNAALVIIRLDGLEHHNKAAANVLKEALKVREFGYKPTWLAECGRRFGPGHPSYNEAVGDYIEERFDIVDLSDEDPKTRAQQAALDAAAQDILDSGGVSMGADVETPRLVDPPTSKERFFADPEPDPEPDSRRYVPGGKGKRNKGKGQAELE